MRGTGYLTDDGLATALFCAARLGQPLLLEGEAGVGKTSAALALATALDTPLIRLQCYEGIDIAEAVYEWNYPRQLLAIRLAETEGQEVATGDLFRREFLVQRPLLRGGRPPRAAAGRPADRRDRPRGRAFRGLSAGAAGRAGGHHPGAGHASGGHPADRHPDLQPHPRRARCPQAALPVPLDRPPGRRSGGRHRPRPGAGGEPGAGHRRRGRRRPAAHPRPAKAARHRRGDRLAAGVAGARP